MNKVTKYIDFVLKEKPQGNLTSTKDLFREQSEKAIGTKDFIGGR